jgi:hypothetical protein
LKKQVARPVNNSLQQRELVGEVISERDPNCNYSDMRIPIQPVAKSLEGKWGSRRTIEKRRGTLPGV